MDETEKYIFWIIVSILRVSKLADILGLSTFQDIKYPSFVSTHMGVWLKVYGHVWKDSELNIPD